MCVYFRVCDRAVIKLVLLLKYRQGIQRQTPLLPLDRRSDLVCLQRNHNSNLNNNRRQLEREAELEAELEAAAAAAAVVEPGNGNGNNGGNGHGAANAAAAAAGDQAAAGTSNGDVQTLKRSGRVMRTLDKAPPRSQRTWMLPTHDPHFRQMINRCKANAPPTALDDHQVLAEVLHTIRPVAHLGAMALFGELAWTPYVVSLGLDISSLKLLHEPHDKMWNHNETVELGQRSFALLLYLLRSPFYDRVSKERILRTLSFLADKIPIFGRLIRPLVSYLPEWQKTYFYVWSM